MPESCFQIHFDFVRITAFMAMNKVFVSLSAVCLFFFHDKEKKRIERSQMHAKIDHINTPKNNALSRLPAKLKCRLMDWDASSVR